MSSSSKGESPPTILTHPLDPSDAAALIPMAAAARSTKGMTWTIDARPAFDALMEGVQARDDVTFERDMLGHVPGIWVNPRPMPADKAILHLHGGWFNAGSANAYRHLVAHIAARAGARTFVPDYRLAPEHCFPAAVDDVLAAFRGMHDGHSRRIAITGDSAGGNLALVVAAEVAATPLAANVVGVVALSPVTDLTLSGATYETRADADPFFTKTQVAGLVRSYLGGVDANDPWASPLQGTFAGLPPVRIHVGDNEVLLDDARRYAQRAAAAGIDVQLDVWMGMPHGFVGSVGRLKAAGQALDSVGSFIADRLA